MTGAIGDKCGYFAYPYNVTVTKCGFKWDVQDSIVAFAQSASACNELCREEAKIAIQDGPGLLVVGPNPTISDTSRVVGCLTIAGSDSSGGAGIQADLKTFSANRCYGASVITAVTAQNTCGVYSVFQIPSTEIVLQIEAVLSDIPIDAIKVGMLNNVETIKTVSQQLRALGSSIPIVVDPVMVAKGGCKLIQDDAVEAIKRHLLPLASVITPNVPEACALLEGYRIDTRDDMEVAAQRLCELGCMAVLLKGGHLENNNGNSDDLLYTADGSKKWYEAQRVSTKNCHGTGCTLSSAIAANLAHGLLLADAIQKAKNYVHGALVAARDLNLGHGHGPVHHFYAQW